MTTAEFSKFAGILSAALSQHHLLGEMLVPSARMWALNVPSACRGKVQEYPCSLAFNLPVASELGLWQILLESEREPSYRGPAADH